MEMLVKVCTRSSCGAVWKMVLFLGVIWSVWEEIWWQGIVGMNNAVVHVG